MGRLTRAIYYSFWGRPFACNHCGQTFTRVDACKRVEISLICAPLRKRLTDDRCDSAGNTSQSVCKLQHEEETMIAREGREAGRTRRELHLNPVTFTRLKKLYLEAC